MRHPIRSILRAAAVAMLLTAAAAALPQEAGSAASGRYTAQRRPRVTVLDFEEVEASHGLSVEAMLETFLQRESQFVVVERQKLDGLLEERQRMQKGIVEIPPGDTASRKLLEKTDLFIQGTVTRLDLPGGPRIEIDANLTGYDGRLVAAAQRGGPAGCLRAIVRRLGIALEQDFLRPYYGRLELNLTQPENVRIFLTPISLDTAPDAERSPLERSATVTGGGEYDVVESWITDQTSYTIENLLSGWYSLRLARPGYEDLGTYAARWEVRNRSGELEVYDRLTRQPLSRTDPKLQRFVVHIDPLATGVIDGDTLRFVLRKQGGSLAPRVKRQYRDEEFSHAPQRVVLMGGSGLRLNRLDDPESSDDDPECDLFDERRPAPPEFSRTHVLPGQTFDFAQFKGGELIIDDYKGELVPAGKYQLALWDPNYQVEKTGVIVRDQDLGKATETALARQTWTLRLEVTGARPASQVILEGRDTGYRLALPLDFTDPREQRGLPADAYTVSTDVPGLDGWRQTVNLMPETDPPPRYFARSGRYKPKIDRPSQEDKKPALGASLTIKTRLALAGRLDVLNRPPETMAADLFADREVLQILDLLLHGQPLQPGLPSDPDELRRLLEQRLKVIDLLVLDPRDMAQLRRSPEVAAVVRRFVEAGGALFAFVSEAGDYGEVVGAPLVIEVTSKLTDRFELAPGDVGGIVPRPGRNVGVKSKRVLPKLSGLPAEGPWRVIAFTQERQGPRIIERGKREEGGYVALWLDDPGSFRGRLGERVPKVEVVRARVEERVLNWARYLMYRRYDKAGDALRQAEQALLR